jgi:hypothetical protein
VAVAAVVVVGVCGWGAGRAAPAGLAVATAIAFAALPYAVWPAAADASVRKMADMVRAAHTGNEVIGTYDVFVRNLVFYSGIVHTDIINDDHLREWLASHGRALIVMPASDADRLERLSWLTFERVGALPYFDDGSLRVGTLLWPDPANDLDTVVLARVSRR